jgi:hypothetical protein
MRLRLAALGREFVAAKRHKRPKKLNLWESSRFGLYPNRDTVPKGLAAFRVSSWYLKKDGMEPRDEDRHTKAQETQKMTCLLFVPLRGC